MSKLIQNKSFQIGFLLAALTLIFINIGLFILVRFSRHQCGFPFPFYEWHFVSNVGKVGNITFYDTVTESRILWQGFVADLVFITILSLIIGIIFKFVWSKIQARKLK